MDTNLKLAIYILCFSNFLARAQAQQPIWFHSLGKEDGLSANTIHDVFVDSGGFTWIGSEEGLFRFDGRTIKQYPTHINDSTALMENYISGNFFEEDKEKNIWFCSVSSIHCYRRKSDDFRRYFIKKNGIDISNGYYAICIERDTFLWLRAGDNELFRFNIYDRTYTKTKRRTELDINVFPGFSPDGKLKYLFSVDGQKSQGLEVFKHDGFGNLSDQRMYFDGGDTENPPLFIANVLFDHDTAVWLAANSGIYKWHIDNDVETFPTENNSSIEISKFGQDQFIVSESGNGLQVFDKGMGRYSKMNAKSLKLMDAGSKYSFYDPFYDRFGNLWMLHDNEGLVFSSLAKTKFESIPKMPLFDKSKNYDFRTILQDKENNIWCSTFGDGIFLLDEHGKTLKHYHPKNPNHNSLFDKRVHHIMLDNLQNIWVGTTSGVAVAPPPYHEFHPIFDSEGEHVPYMVYFHQLENGDILGSTMQQGVYRVIFSDGQWRLKQILTPQSSNDFHLTIYEDSLGTIYINNKLVEIDVYSYSGEKSLSYSTSLPISGSINGFYEDKNGIWLWIATSNGLVRLDKTNLADTIRYYTEKDGIVNKNIQSMVADQEGDLWMGTTKGLVRFNIADSSFTHFTLADGIQSSVFNELAVLRHVNGSLWFLGNKGVTIVKPDKVNPLVGEPKIQITKIEINSITPDDLVDKIAGAKNVSELKVFDRPYGDNDLLFEFVGIDYSDPEAVRLGYRMDGINNDTVWLEKGEKGIARFPDLPHGDYTFSVFAKNSDGNGLATKFINFTIAPHWTNTWPFKSLVTLSLLALLYAYYRFRIAQIRKKEEMLRKEEEFKRKEAELKQQMAETETAILRLQMNPHFIFNSMNSINSYILKKDIDTASDYLGRFSRLMRMILDLAANQYISVYEEKELLELYIQTEAMRFEEKFSYQIEVANGLDPDDTILPTMILQPFVENAIWHGLSGKGGQGQVTVRFEQQNDSLVCSVEDNGIGREAAARAKAGDNKHVSKALAITARRLELLEKETGQPATCKITDLKGPDGQPAGTKVTLILPML